MKRKAKENLPVIQTDQITSPDEVPGIDNIEKQAYLYMIKCWEQVKIANLFQCSPQTVSANICKFKDTPELKKRLVSAWERSVSIDLRRKSSEILQSINSDKMVEGSKAQSIGILIDKARLIDGESTENIAYADFTRELKDIEAEERSLASKLE